ncbi:MAG TPA: hypothetical protein QF469_16070 [Sphingomonas sanguinis]|uniref:hypothetical protein n=1 Tax=Sphingomonas sanguinis TaxID=33051 RepID=UPI002AC0BA0C|nr:hypothetical protein [Sphingomonas sanguinis]
MIDDYCWSGMGRLAVLAVALALTAASAPRYDWSTADLSYLGDYAQTPAVKASRALCARLVHLTPPPSDTPDAIQAGLQNCDSEALLYGIGRPADPAAARRCAWADYERSRDDSTLPYFDGPGILAVAYANGWGGPRNLDMAIHMACGIEDAAAATQARIEHLQKLAVQGPRPKPFSLCDDISSGMSGGVCAAHKARLADQDRGRTIALWKRDWSTARRVAFARVYASMADYADTAHESDCHGGTAAAQCAINGAQRDMARFMTRVGALLGHHGPPARSPLVRRNNAATHGTGWADMLRDMPADERPVYEENGRKTRAARARFERDLLAFAATIPGTTPHRTRTLFADI